MQKLLDHSEPTLARILISYVFSLKKVILARLMLLHGHFIRIVQKCTDGDC